MDDQRKLRAGSVTEPFKDPALAFHGVCERDPGVLSSHVSFSEREIESHHHEHYVGFSLPGKGRDSGIEDHHRHHHHHHRKRHKNDTEPERPVTPPSERVQFILGEDAEDSDREPHPIFSEMEELVWNVHKNDYEWREVSRWVKFEEDVEESGNRWSKPHVSTLSLHALFELRSFILNGSFVIDFEASSLEDIADACLDHVIKTGQLNNEQREHVKAAILKQHNHVFQHDKKNVEAGAKGKISLVNSLADIGRKYSSHIPGIRHNRSHGDDLNDHEDARPNGSPRLGRQESSWLHNLHFMKKVPPGSETCNILVGECSFLENPMSAFVRLAEAKELGDLTEIPVPTRFLFILLGPTGNIARYHEVGRVIGTLMSDDVFHDLAYKAMRRKHLVAGVDEFLDAVTVLPPGEWDPTIRIEPPENLPSQEPRKHKAPVVAVEFNEEEEEAKQRQETGLVRTGRFFGGLRNDIMRKRPFYLSDFKDFLSPQCVASWLFLYFACLTPIITFGGLLGIATDQKLAAIESLLSGLICGLGFGLFSGQPLTILGSTGPVLVFEGIVYEFSKQMQWEYLSFRLWIGVWLGVILIFLVATDASAYVCYITRFTEENFATLIAVIFMYEAVDKVDKIRKKYPITMPAGGCYCEPPQYIPTPTVLPNTTTAGLNFTRPTLMTTVNFTNALNFTSTTAKTIFSPTFASNFTTGGNFKTGNDAFWRSIQVEKCVAEGGVLSPACTYEPNVFFVSVLLFLLTFIIAFKMKGFKETSFFPTIVRKTLSDFAVIIAIVGMTLVDWLLAVKTPKLEVPATFAPTHPDRGWFIPPLNGNPWWTIIAAIIPALLATILIFMDQQITAVIVNRREHQLKKGCGYHLDLFVLSILIIICSVLGIPWFVAATVLSLNHVNSLKMETDTAAPGEKPQFLGVREQRVTNVLIFLTIGLSVFFVPILKLVPMPVLYGVFLYMGAASLNGLQFFDRMCILFMPMKYQPDVPYLRRVDIRRVHIFTFVQIFCFVALWVIKSIKQTKILFPIMLVVIIGIRKLLEKYFTVEELRALDDILPEFRRKEIDEVERESQAHEMQMDEEDDDEDEDDEDVQDQVDSIIYSSEGTNANLTVSDSLFCFLSCTGSPKKV